MPQPDSGGRVAYATTALVCGIISVVVPVLGFPVAVFAIVLGFLGRKDWKRDPNLTGKGMATAGVVLGCVAVLETIGIIIVVDLVGNQLGRF